MTRRLSAAVLLLLALSTGCGPTHRLLVDTGQGAPREYPAPTSRTSSQLDAGACQDALAHWVVHAPLPLRAPQQPWLVRASYPQDTDTRWQRLMSKSFGGLCAPGHRKDSCLSLLDDAMG
jgi:hypothetical protein